MTAGWCTFFGLAVLAIWCWVWAAYIDLTASFGRGVIAFGAAAVIVFFTELIWRW